MQRSHERQALPPSAGADSAAEGEGETGFVTASHLALFEQPEAVCCDACGDEIAADTDFEVAGEGEYLWTRGDEVRFEKAPLCAHCGTAILRAAFTRWEIEEDEG